MAHETHDVVVVGAGLAGLACARQLEAFDVVVLEAGDAVGGRVRTDHVDGYTLDRGFQVLNTGYPALKGRVDLDALDLRPFDPAVALHLDGHRHVLGNPLQRPSTIKGALGLPIGGLRGKTALAAYAGACLALPASRLLRRDDVSSAEAWAGAHVPDAVAEQVLRTFFSGVLLEREMTTSRRFTDLMMKMFVVGASTVPSRGMQALPEQLAAHLPPGVLRLGTAGPLGLRDPGRDRRGHPARPRRRGRHRRLGRRRAGARDDDATRPRRDHRLPLRAGVPDGVLDAAARRRRLPRGQHDRAQPGGAGVRPSRSRPGLHVVGAPARRRPRRRRRAPGAGAAARHRHRPLGRRGDLRPAARPAGHAGAAPVPPARARRGRRRRRLRRRRPPHHQLDPGCPGLGRSRRGRRGRPALR